MNFLNHKVIGVASFSAVSTINVILNLIFSQPAISAVSCEPGNISRYGNGSLKSCVLARDTKARIGSNQAGISIFPCKAKKYITFTEKSQFQSCTLAEGIKIRRGNSVTSCLTDYIVSVSTSSDGKLSIECSRS